MSVLYATFLRCIKPYINHNTIALEIGPGRGAWTKALLPSKEVWVMDSLPEVHNRFFEYLGNAPNVKYFQVQNFKCEMLPDNYFNYMFSFGCLCHVSFEGIKEYAVNLYPKLKQDSHCFWMVADYDNYNNVIQNINRYSIWRAITPRGSKFLPLKIIFEFLIRREKPILREPDKDQEPRPGRWYHAGISRTCSMLKEVGYEIVDPDVGTILRDPIIYFSKT
jgi:hypothetical protein